MRKVKDEGGMMNDEFGFPWRRPVRLVEEKEVKQFGEYRTRRLVVEPWDGQGQG